MDQTVIDEGARSGRPWWQICCGGCFLFVVALVIGGAVLMRSIVGPGLVLLPDLPDNFPKDIVPYRLEKVHSIAYLEGKSKSKMLNVLAAPLQLFAKATGQGPIDQSTITGSQKAIAALGSDAQYIDTVTMTWRDLGDSRAAVLDYYLKQFQKASLTVESAQEDARHDSVSGIKEGMIVELSLESESSSSTADTIEFVVSYSNKH